MTSLANYLTLFCRLNGEAEQMDANKAGELYNKAAETATACMKGKLANKYYMLAEEAWGQCDEE